jgi:hypothetical protein
MDHTCWNQHSFIHPGQKAELKLDTFPFQKYGTIDAELFYVSPDAQEDQKMGLVTMNY